MRIANVNMEAEVRQGFDVIQAGSYDLKIVSEEAKTTPNGHELIEFQLEFVDPVSSLTTADGQEAKNVGKIFYTTFLNPEWQANLRALVEGAGLTWGDGLDTEELMNREIKAQVKVVKEIKTKDGEIKVLANPRNEIKKIFKAE